MLTFSIDLTRDKYCEQEIPTDNKLKRKNFIIYALILEQCFQHCLLENLSTLSLIVTKSIKS